LKYKIIIGGLSMKDVKEHFDSEAKAYDSLILTLIPNYSEMTDVLVNSIPFD
jgi:hypothetical protein